jgi:alkylation response protein AidB-like acyl-CoA dehydrogenase
VCKNESVILRAEINVAKRKRAAVRTTQQRTAGSTYPVMYPIYDFGSEAQREKYLPKLAR